MLYKTRPDQEPNAGTPRAQRHDPATDTATSVDTVSRQCVSRWPMRRRHAAVNSNIIMCRSMQPPTSPPLRVRSARHTALAFRRLSSRVDAAARRPSPVAVRRRLAKPCPRSRPHAVTGHSRLEDAARSRHASPSPLAAAQPRRASPQPLRLAENACRHSTRSRPYAAPAIAWVRPHSTCCCAPARGRTPRSPVLSPARRHRSRRLVGRLDAVLRPLAAVCGALSQPLVDADRARPPLHVHIVVAWDAAQ